MGTVQLKLMMGFCLAGMTVCAAPPEWEREKAFAFLESRQRKWAEWPRAQKPGGTCVSCHTGLPYLVARKAQGLMTENDLVRGVRTRLASHPPGAMLHEQGTEAVLQLLTLALQRRSAAQAPDQADQEALRRLWDKQIGSGEHRGAWEWINQDLHPFESESSMYFGATLAQKALRAYPAQETGRIGLANEYLSREAANQPLHNRLAWVAFTPAVAEKTRTEVLKALWAAQSADGGWTIASLGPWAEHPKAPPDAGSNAYATAWAAYAAREAGVACSDPRLQRGFGWLEKNQDRSSGAWNAVSMNREYPEGSMPSLFMTDTATGFAAAALAGCGR